MMSSGSRSCKLARNDESLHSQANRRDRLHTLQNVAYTNYLEDGMKFKSLNNLTVRVRVKEGDIYFNNAKVIEPNVLTNNGLIHMYVISRRRASYVAFL